MILKTLPFQELKSIGLEVNVSTYLFLVFCSIQLSIALNFEMPLKSRRERSIGIGIGRRDEDIAAIDRPTLGKIANLQTYQEGSSERQCTSYSCGR